MTDMGQDSMFLCHIGIADTAREAAATHREQLKVGRRRGDQGNELLLWFSWFKADFNAVSGSSLSEGRHRRRSHCISWCHRPRYSKGIDFELGAGRHEEAPNSIMERRTCMMRCWQEDVRADYAGTAYIGVNLEAERCRCPPRSVGLAWEFWILKCDMQTQLHAGKSQQLCHQR
jgi:hypothetical protein